MLSQEQKKKKKEHIYKLCYARFTLFLLWFSNSVIFLLPVSFILNPCSP